MTVTATNKKRKIIVKGREFESLESAAREFGMSRNTLDYRLSKGWTPEEAVGIAPRPEHAANTAGVPITVQGRAFKNIRQAAKHYGRAYTHVFNRLKEGCSYEQALGLVKRTDTLQTEYPELAKQWHPHKNAALTADDSTPHSGRKVWWLCPKGHEWEAVINSRTRGCGCPYCAKQRPTVERNFTTEFPELMPEWDWDKNSPMRPDRFTRRSTSKVWWRCQKGHSWQASISNRTRETARSCPCCGNRVLCSEGSNSLAKARPDIAQDWHPAKNAPLSPNDVVAGGTKKIWWICKHGHEWRTAINARTNSGTGCPKCCNQTSRIEIAVYTELHALFDDVLWREKVFGSECDIYLRQDKIGVEIDGVYWHRRRPEVELAKSAALEANGIRLFRLREDGLPLLTERDISYKSADDEFLVISRLASKLLQHAAFSEQQRSKLLDYVAGKKLINEAYYRKIVAHLPAPPLEQSLAVMQPKIAAQWAYDLNAPLSPEHFRHKANKKVWWRCEQGHTWIVSINNRTQHATGCSVCPRPIGVAPNQRNLAGLNPTLASEWHPTKNGDLRPEQVWPKSNRKVWWLCSEGHEWQAVVGGRAAGSNCPYCYGRFASKENNLAFKYPELLSDWDAEKNKGLNPSDFTPHVGKKIWWLCKNGHSWQATIYNRAKNKSGCPKCAQNASRRYTIEDFKAIAKKRGGDCISDKFISVRKKLKFICKEGHIWETRADSVLYTEKWCPTCGLRR